MATPCVAALALSEAVMMELVNRLVRQLVARDSDDKGVTMKAVQKLDNLKGGTPQ